MQGLITGLGPSFLRKAPESLQLFKRPKSTEERDNVFGLWGLFDCLSPGTFPKPDYSQDTVDIFAGATAGFIQ